MSETTTKTYSLEMNDGASWETQTFADEPTTEQCEEACQEWVKGGEWGDDGASISARWTLTDADGDEIDSGSVTVEIEPDHSAQIRAALGDKWHNATQHERCCGDSPDDHDWTSEGEGGLDSNPGVWSTGGTSLSIADHCRTCGLHRSRHLTGSQRNPGEHDTTRYEMPESWCAECEAD